MKTLRPFHPWRIVAALLALLTIASHAETNIAAARPVVANGATTNAASNVTDGDSSTFTAPATAGVIGFYYQIDLGQEYPLLAIDLYSRVNDGTNRLSRVRMAVYSDNGGVPGVERWGYEIRADGSNNLQGGVDRLSADLHAAGTFRGRFIRLTNIANTSNAPQIAEIEVFEAPTPKIGFFGPDAGHITKIGAPGKPSQAVLSWSVSGYTALTIDQGIGPVTGPTGSVTVSPNTMTTYTLTATNGAGVSTKTVTIGVDQAELPPTISEFLASNATGIRDPNGNRSDWVEIANPNPFAINLAGYYLTDNPINKTKWQFPSFSVPGNGHAIVFASNSTAPAVPFAVPQTSFALATGGEYVGLIAPDGSTLLSQIPLNYPTVSLYPRQTDDHSYGVTGGIEGYYSVPTPNAPNGPRFDGVVEDTVFNIRRGFYSTPQSVTITTPTPSAQIRYTTDGSTPTSTTGTVYTGAITISATTVLRAAAFRTGWAPTNVDTQTYIFTADVKASSPSKGWVSSATITAMTDQAVDEALKEVPSMSLTTGPGVTIDGGFDKLATLEWIDPAGGTGFQIPCGAQLFGGAFTNFAKKSFRISFKGEYGAPKLRFPLFAGFDRGLKAAEEFDQLELRNGSHDMNQRGFYMSNIFTDATMLDMGSFAPHGRFVHLYINGNYWGLYHLRERWAADMMAEYYGGDAAEYESINGNLNAGGWAEPGLPYDGTDAQWTQSKALARSGPDTYEKLRPLVDVPQYVDYMIMWMFGKSEDEYRAVGPIGPGHGFKFVLNDADGYLFYAPYTGPASDRTTRTIPGPGRQAGDGPGSLFSMLYRDGGSDYRALLADRIQRAYVTPGGAMTPEQNAARLTELCNMITKSMQVESARWNYMTQSAWMGHRDACLNWFTTRTSTVLGHYQATGFYPATNPPVLNLPPGTVTSGTNLTMSTTTVGGVIYYTADGSDPRVESAAPPNTPLITEDTVGKYRVPANANEGVTAPTIAGLQAFYPLNGTTEEPINNLSGTLTNGAQLSTSTTPLVRNQYAKFDGANDSIQLGNPEPLKMLGQITLAAWVRPDLIAGERNILARGTDAATAPDGETFLRINNGFYEGGISLAGGSTLVRARSATNLAFTDLGVWTHVAIVYDGTTWRLFRNGVEIATTVHATGAVPAVTGWAIGAKGSGDGRFFNGRIDDVRIYNRGLTQTEVAILANNAESSPEAQWTRVGYNDAVWQTAAGTVGFAPAADAFLQEISHDVSGIMQGANASLYRRYTFHVTTDQKSKLQSLGLRIKSDDGYGAYLNGARVAGRNAAYFLLGDANASAETPDATALTVQNVDLSAWISSLEVGENVLAIQGLNLTAGDDDFLLGVELFGQQGPPGGSLSAQAYSAPVALVKNTVVRARTYNPTTKEWSGLEDRFYQVGSDACPVGALAVSELHYNPIADGDGEFIELLNVSDAAINLRSVKFTFGVEFQFPGNRDTILAPGQRLVLVDSELTFQKIHGWSAPLGGIYSGAFNNAGERLQIVAADGVTALIDFTYGGGTAPWPNAADGEGHSLVLINPVVGIDHNDPANWRVSRLTHGNPNTSDALAFVGPPTIDADGDGLNACLEFALGTNDLIPNVLPIAMIHDAQLGFTISVEHANGADVASLKAQASGDLLDWNVPVELLKRELLPNGRLESLWRAVPVDPVPDRLFFRFAVP